MEVFLFIESEEQGSHGNQYGANWQKANPRIAFWKLLASDVIVMHASECLLSIWSRDVVVLQQEVCEAII